MGIITNVSINVEYLFGYSQAEMMGKNINIAMPQLMAE